LAILNPDHLLEQGFRIVSPPRARLPRQVDLRRAISNAYYAVFHATLAAAADEFVGVGQRSSETSSLAYRSISHRNLRDWCENVKKPQPSARFVRYASAGFDQSMRTFAAAVVELQERRHSADYDPSERFRKADAILALSTGQAALSRLRGASAPSRRMFLSVLLFQPR